MLFFNNIEMLLYLKRCNYIQRLAQKLAARNGKEVAPKEQHSGKQPGN
jgi:hypothetical protein